jgi:hypothetical protein
MMMMMMHYSAKAAPVGKRYGLKPLGRQAQTL